MLRTTAAVVLLQIALVLLAGWGIANRTVSISVTALLSAALIGGWGLWQWKRWRTATGQIVQMLERTAQGNYGVTPGKGYPGDPEGVSVASALESMNDAIRQRENRQNSRLAQMDAMLSGMIEGVLATDATGAVVLANQAACRMLARTGPELQGRRLLETVRYPALHTAMEEAARRLRPHTIELATNEVPSRQILASVTPLGGTSRGGLAVVMHDVTELRRMEVIRRDFVANVSHELKTPLAVIKACAETLLMGALRDESVNGDFVRQIETQADQLAGHVQQLLELSRAQTGSLQGEVALVDLDQACRQAVQQFQAEAERQQIQLIASAGHELIAETDEDTVKSALNNLISNALRYTPAGGRVVVSTRCEPGVGIIEVADTGIGIAPEFHDRIFERYFRVDQARSRSAGGSGLGLAIVKHRVLAIGGKIEVNSQTGKGSVFRVTIPLRHSGPTRSIFPHSDGG